MAEGGRNKLSTNDSDKAALGRKLLNKHQKIKTARSNNSDKRVREGNEELVQALIPTNDEISFTNSETISGNGTPELVPEQAETQAMPIQQYFTIPNNSSFFDLDKITIEDPELKHNEIFSAHNKEEPNVPQAVSDATTESSGTVPQNTAAEPHPASFPHFKSDVEQQLAIDSLQSQLQQQVLTNSHLLGENAQLQGEVHHSRTIITQQSDQIGELKQRAESAETRHGEAQRQLDAQRRLAEEWRAKAEEGERAVGGVRKDRDVALQDASEVLERLAHAQDEGARVKELVGQLRGQLDMANMRIQQLVTTAGAQSFAGSGAAAQEGEARERELLLEKQVSDVQVALEAVRSERDVAAHQYQLYNSQLGEQVAALQAEVATLRAGTEQLVGRERDLVAHIGDMERLLQQQQQPPPASAGDGSVQLEQVRQQCTQLTERLQASCAERDEALKELEHLHGLTDEVQELRNAQLADTAAQTKLLAEIRGDKVALSRAIEQNLVLKAQVTEMETAYLTVTQDKVAPLTDQLATATHRLHGYERSLRTLQDAVEVKDRELQQMRHCEAQVDQLQDRLRHYEAVHRQQEHQHHHHSHHGDGEEQEHGDGSGSESPCQHHQHPHEHEHEHGDGGAADRENELQQEIFQLKQQVDELRRDNAELAIMSQEEREEGQQQQQQQLEEEGEKGDEDTGTNKQDGTDTAEDVVTRKLSRAKAAQQLEYKFTRTMAELAALNDEKQRLEHLVLQLQSETETIGEYVALYQRQRSLLAQRTAAREAQLRHLQARLGDLAAALQQDGGGGSGGGSGGGGQRARDLLAEIRSLSSASDLMLAEQERHEHHVGEVMAGGAACGGGCTWCQGKLMTV